MDKKKICFIAQFPPPLHGLSKAVDTLYNSKLLNKFTLEKINIADNKKILMNLLLIYKSNADLFYFTISQTRLGNLRDLLILNLLNIQHKKCLIHLHGGYYRKLIDNDIPKWQRKANIKALKNLEGTIVLGESLKSIFKDLIPDNKIYVVPNCVDNEYLMSDKEFDLKIIDMKKKKIKHILYLSNFIASKGYPEVLRMAAIEKNRCQLGKEKEFHFDFAGAFFDKNEEKFFFSYIRENKLEDYVTYHGIVTGDRKRQLLHDSDIFILLTRYPNEGQPISILEAMGNGLAVITTDHAGIPDIVRENINGIVIKNKKDIAENVYKRMKQIEYKQFANNNRKSVLKKYTQDIYVNNIYDLFLQIIK